METKTIDIHDAQSSLTELLKLVISGNEVILTDGSKPLARIIPVTADKASATRTPGLHAGAITTTEDFDAPLPDDFWTS